MERTLIKKVFSGLLALVFAMSSAACAMSLDSGNGESNSSEAGGATSSSESLDDEKESTSLPQESSSEEETSNSESSSEEKPEVSDAVELYQLAPENNVLMQSYVIKTKENKLIVIDGGIDGAGIYAEAYLPAAMRAILGLGQDDYFEVEAWFISHAHKDHFYELAKMLNEYYKGSNYKINNFYFDFPEFGTIEYQVTNPDQDYLNILKDGFDNYAKVNGIEVQSESKSYYDDLNGAVINEQAIQKGLDITIDDVRFEIMQTWSGSDISGDVNATSLVMRAWVEGQSVLFLNDIGVSSGKRLATKYGDSVKSDIVQMAHHGQRGCAEDLYKLIQADVHLWATPRFVWTNTTTYEIGINRQWVNNGVDFTTASSRNIVACLYEKYPTLENCNSVAAWREAKDYQKITLPYQY